MAGLALSDPSQKGHKIMSANYTPGPWVNDEGLVTGRDEMRGGPSFDIFDASEWPGPESEGQANARLIAAAREMWEFIQEIASAVDGRASGGLIEKARAILARLDPQS